MTPDYEMPRDEKGRYAPRGRRVQWVRVTLACLFVGGMLVTYIIGRVATQTQGNLKAQHQRWYDQGYKAGVGAGWDAGYEHGYRLGKQYTEDTKR